MAEAPGAAAAASRCPPATADAADGNALPGPDPAGAREAEGLVQIRRLYLSAVPLRLWAWPEPLPRASAVLATVVDHPLAAAYPPPNKFRRTFLKKWMRKLEQASPDDDGSAAAVLDDLYVRMAELMVLTGDDEDWCYKSYWLADGVHVTLSESSKMISEATTGLCTWGAGLAFCTFIEAYPGLFTGGTVLELGAGVGLVGLLLAKKSPACRVVLSDFSPHVINKLEENVVRGGAAEVPPAALPAWPARPRHAQRRATSCLARRAANSLSSEQHTVQSCPLLS